MAIINLFIKNNQFDFRIFVILIGGLFYFPTILIDIWLIANNEQVDYYYNKLFFEKEKPNLPNDHFFGY
jgi:hypothetical protein